jgi:hypothetical protein
VPTLTTLTRASLVLFIFLIDFLQTIVAAWSVWALVIENWGDVQTLEQPPRVAVAAPIFSAGGEYISRHGKPLEY